MTDTRDAGGSPYDPFEKRPSERLTVFLIAVDTLNRTRLSGSETSSLTYSDNSRHVTQGVPFEWSDPTGCVLIKVWPKNAAQVLNKGLRLISGWPIKVQGHLAGHYSSVEFDIAGRGVVRQDIFGLHALYTGTAREVTLISNRPHLIADEIERLTGKTAARDNHFAAWLAFARFPISYRTGFKDVRCLPYGTTANIHPRKGVKYSYARPPWLFPKTGVCESDIDRIESELIENLRAAVQQLTHTPRLQLTGGRDSRLILALLIRAGLLHDVEVVTLGQPDAPDALVASDLAKRLGVLHTVAKWGDGLSTREDLCAHVGLVAGATSCFDSSRSLSKDGNMTISGLTGETLRSNWAHRSDCHDLDAVAQAFFNLPYGRARMLRREAYAVTLHDGLKCLLEPAQEGAEPEDLFDIYYIQHRLRRWLSARPERFADEFFPLYHLPAVEVAFQLGWKTRRNGRIHDTIIARGGKVLSETPYYKPGGFYRTQTSYGSLTKRLRQRPIVRLFNRARARPCQLTDKQSHTLIAKTIDRTFSKLEPLPTAKRAKARQTISEKKKAAYRELVLTRSDNEAFDLIDRDRLIEAIDVLEQLDAFSFQEVHGAMASVIWLGRLESQS